MSDQTSDPHWIVEHYLKAFYAGDPKARHYLADDFRFSGPSASFDNADGYIKASAHAAAGTTAITIDKLTADGDDVCVFYTLHLDHRVSTSPVAEWFHLEHGRIVSSRLILDTAPFMPRRASAGEPNYAVDPVCHMKVDKAAPAATHDHRGATYYFCSTGCADAFAHSPADYVEA